MKRTVNKKLAAAGIIGVIVFVLVGLAVYLFHFYKSDSAYWSKHMMIEGEYCVDGGEWKPIPKDKRIEDHFQKIVFKGRVADETPVCNLVSISSKNVWYTLRRSSDGQLIMHYVTPEEDIYLDEYIQSVNGYRWERTGDYSEETQQLLTEEPKKQLEQALKMPDTPGYAERSVLREAFGEGGSLMKDEFILEVETPYPHLAQSFSDCMSFTLTSEGGSYIRFFYEVIPALMWFTLLCLFGLFVFPISGFVLGGIKPKYISFGIMCFFWGLYMIMQSVGSFSNLWITDPTVCMFIDKLVTFSFMFTLLLYFRSNIEDKKRGFIAGLICIEFAAAAAVILLLQVFFAVDIMSAMPIINIITMANAAVLGVLLILEMKTNKKTKAFLLSWIPLAIMILVDIMDLFIHFPGSHYFRIGLAVTMIYQLIVLMRDLKNQYRESIRYQQVQKELYEAKVAVMTSQIQPHFMYNALTSIAMMCQIDPDTAQEATVTFAKYLRGNMDSLKQTKPVPFETELEHLKKYLYIEKLRFGKKLNVEYDIQATDFKLPMLSVQPLVENAVKHGVGMKKGGGTVTISTRETEDAFEVVISDDGVGFDTTAEKQDDGRSHVGMENTRTRLKEMCGAEITIESTVGVGTTATIRLPKEGQKDEDTVS